MFENIKNRFILWVRESQVWGFLLSVVVMLLVAFFFFYPDAQQGNSLQQSDIMQGMANGHEAQEYYEQTGEKTMWTNALFSGMPTFQISPSYENNSLFDWIDSFLRLGLPGECGLLFVMMLGMLIMLYALRCRWYYALIGAVAWGFSSYFIIIIGAGHIWKFLALTYVPPTIAGLVLAYRGRYISGGALTAIAAMMQLASNHPQMSYYFALVMLALVIGWLVEAIQQKQLKRWCIASGVTCLAGGVAVSANLPSLYLTYEYGKETQRAGSELGDDGTQTKGMDSRQALAYSYYPTETFTLFIPNVKGGASAGPKAADDPEPGGLVAMTVADLLSDEEIENDSISMSVRQYNALSSYLATGSEEDLSEFERPNTRYDRMISVPLEDLLGAFPQYFQHPGEGTNGPVYVGVIIFAFFIVGCVVVRGPVKWALLVMTVLSVVLAWGYNCMPVSEFFLKYVPLYNKFRAPESILVVAEFTIPVIAILGMQRLFESKEGEERSRMFRVSCWTFGALGFVCLLGWIFPSIFGSVVPTEDNDFEVRMLTALPDLREYVESARKRLVSVDCLRSLMYLSLAFVCLFAWYSKKVKHTLAVGGVGVFVLVDMWTVDKRYVRSSSYFKDLVTTTASYEPNTADKEINRIAKERGLKHYRVFDTDQFGGSRTSYFHSSIGGYHAAKLRRYDDLLTKTVNVEYEDTTVAVPPINIPAVQDMLNARFIVSQGKAQENPYAMGNAWVVSNIEYVDGARAEFDALGNLDPWQEAVADKQFEAALGKPDARAAGSVELTDYAPNRLAYKANITGGDAIVVFSEVFFPWGWKATVDGKDVPIGRVNYVLRAMRLREGDHEIVMTFDPESVHVTTTIGVIAVIMAYLWLLLALGLWARREFIKSPDDTPTNG